MSVTLRLQGLSCRTNSHDIRQFFDGLDIPQEGITIIGGQKCEAFVDVATWDNAYQALQMSGRQIRDSTIHISVITPEEKQQALEKSQNLVKDSENGRNETPERKSNEGRDSEEKHFYLRLNIGDIKATPEDVKHLFDGLHISDLVIFRDKALPSSVLAITQFDTIADATEGFNRYKDSKVLTVVWSCEKEWMRYGGSVHNGEDERCSTKSRHSQKRTRSRSRGKHSKSAVSHSGSQGKQSRSPRRRSRSPRRRSRSPRRRSRSPRRRSRSPRRRSRSPRRRSRSPRRRSRSPRRRSRSPKRRSRSPRRRSRSPRRRSRSPRKRSRSPKSSSTLSYSKSPASQSDEHDSTDTEGYHLHLMNLSYRSEKEDLKKLFNIKSDDQIVFVYDQNGHRTRTAFITFASKEDFKKASKLNSTSFKGHELLISPISKSSMETCLSKSVCSQTYLYLRHFSPKVTKNDIKEFFDGINLQDDDISLLFDKSHTSLGEALVKFSSLEEAGRAEKLNRKTFKDRQISLRRIHENKLASFLQSNGLFMMSADPNDCVTQEDDLPDEEEEVATQDVQHKSVTQEMGTPKEEPVIKDVKIPECVSQADD